MKVLEPMCNILLYNLEYIPDKLFYKFIFGSASNEVSLQANTEARIIVFPVHIHIGFMIFVFIGQLMNPC